jgi:hypothetical protein
MHASRGLAQSAQRPASMRFWMLRSWSARLRVLSILGIAKLWVAQLPAWPFRFFHCLARDRARGVVQQAILAWAEGGERPDESRGTRGAGRRRRYDLAAARHHLAELHACRAVATLCRQDHPRHRRLPFPRAHGSSPGRCLVPHPRQDVGDAFVTEPRVRDRVTPLRRPRLLACMLGPCTRIGHGRVLTPLRGSGNQARSRLRSSAASAT